MTALSNCASAPNIWNTSIPPGVDVSIGSMSDLNATPRSWRPSTVLDQMTQRSPETVQTPHDESVARPEDAPEQVEQFGAISFLAPPATSSQTLVHPAAARASLCKSNDWSVPLTL